MISNPEISHNERYKFVPYVLGKLGYSTQQQQRWQHHSVCRCCINDGDSIDWRLEVTTHSSRQDISEHVKRGRHYLVHGGTVFVAIEL